MTPLPDLVQADEPRADSRWIAQRVGNDHSSVYRLIADYLDEFEELGVLRFEIEKPPKGSPGGRPKRYALLNEDQSYLLLTYCQNTPQARECKRALVKAFAKARAQRQHNAQDIPPGLPDFTNPSIAARAWADQYELREKLELEAEINRPKVELHDRVINAEGLYTVRQAAKLLGTGQNRLFAWLRERGILMASNEPYQTFVERGYLDVKTRTYLNQSDNTEYIYTQTLITPKGLAWLRGKLTTQEELIVS